MKIKEKNVLVYGAGVSGLAVTDLLVKKKANAFVYDDKGVDNNKLNKGAFIIKELSNDIITQFDFIVVTPSVESLNKYIKFAKANGIRVYSEVEFASLFCRKILAVTGTNGKTTTVEMITQILNQKHKAVACGNIGYPLSRAVMERPRAIKVVEVSSFMLENCREFHPYVATITNIEPDHLIRHKNMSTYTNLKLSIFSNTIKTDYSVINLDNPRFKTKGRVITYSFNRSADVCVRGGFICLHRERVIAINELKVKGKHNIYNVMCAICYAYIMRVGIKSIKKALLNFTLDRFHIEEIAKIDGIKFINDSKSTNISSTLACVNSINEPILLLLGGSNKKLKYNELFSHLSKKVKSIAVFGEIADELIASNKDKFEIKKFEKLDGAFKYLTELAKTGDNIVLSPSSASYDQYKNYIERGEHFNQLVAEYAKQRENK